MNNRTVCALYDFLRACLEEGDMARNYFNCTSGQADSVMKLQLLSRCRDPTECTHQPLVLL